MDNSLLSFPIIQTVNDWIFKDQRLTMPDLELG